MESLNGSVKGYFLCLTQVSQSASSAQQEAVQFIVDLKMDVIKQVYDKVKLEYGKNITNKLKMVDALAVYAVVTALVQLVYMILVGNFPFNSFLSGFICHIGIFALAVCLRLQLTSKGEFDGVTPEKAFGDFAFCALVLLFVVFSFLG